jgi:predicted metalloenzyme YecM
MLTDGCIEFMDKCLSKIEEFKIDISDMDLDHFGYQASSDNDYDNLAKQINEIGTLVHEEPVNGRRVGIIKLSKPIKFNRFNVGAIELVAPKKDQICNSGLEHIEIVANEPLENIIRKYPDLPWDVSKLKQDHFPMITLKLLDGAQVKFHKRNILEIANELNSQKAI